MPGLATRWHPEGGTILRCWCRASAGHLEQHDCALLECPSRHESRAAADMARKRDARCWRRMHKASPPATRRRACPDGWSAHPEGGRMCIRSLSFSCQATTSQLQLKQRWLLVRTSPTEIRACTLHVSVCQTGSAQIRTTAWSMARAHQHEQVWLNEERPCEGHPHPPASREGLG